MCLDALKPDKVVVYVKQLGQSESSHLQSSGSQKLTN